VLSGISVKDLEGETNDMYAVKAGEKNSEIGRTDGEREIECEGRSKRGGGGGSFEVTAVCFHGSIISCTYCHCIGIFFS
jgi:hypothetical protein